MTRSQRSHRRNIAMQLLLALTIVPFSATISGSAGGEELGQESCEIYVDPSYKEQRFYVGFRVALEELGYTITSSNDAMYRISIQSNVEETWGGFYQSSWVWMTLSKRTEDGSWERVQKEESTSSAQSIFRSRGSAVKAIVKEYPDVLAEMAVELPECEDQE